MNVTGLYFRNGLRIHSATIQTTLSAQSWLTLGSGANQFEFTVAVRLCPFHDIAFAHTAEAMSAVLIIFEALEDVLSVYQSLSCGHAALGVRNHAIVLVVARILAFVWPDRGLQGWSLAAHDIFSIIVERFWCAFTKLLIPLIGQVSAASPCSHNGTGNGRFLVPDRCARLAVIVIRLADDVGRAVGWNGNVWNGNRADELLADGTIHIGLSVHVDDGVRLCHSHRIAFRVDSFLHSLSAIHADLPVSIVVDRPFRTQIVVRATCVVVTVLQALVVGIAPMFCKVLALYAEIVVAAHRRDVGIAAIVAEFAIVAAVQTFVAVATLLTDEVVEVILERTVVRTITVFAMITVCTILALAAELAKLVWLEAFTAVGTEMLVPIRTLRTDAVFAMVVFLTFLTKHAVWAFRIVWAFLAVRTNMLFIFARLDAIAMRTTRVFRIGLAASLAKAAIVAKLLTFTFYASAALIAKPAVFLATMNAMCTSTSG